jgi:hypothetical protein
MSDDQLGTISGQGCAAARFADALLRSLGGAQVTLRLSDPSTGDTNSQLGLEVPRAEDMQISPAAIKALAPEADGRRRIEVIASATSLRTIAKNYGIEDIAAWLLSMQGVLHCGGLMRIATVTVDEFHGKQCLYHLTATE